MSGLAGKRVAVLVSNKCDNDSRVLKSAKCLSKLGATVKIFAVYKPNDNAVDYYEKLGDIEVQRNLWHAGQLLKEKLDFIPIKRMRNRLSKDLAKYDKYFSYTETLSEDVVHFNPDVIYAHDLVTLPLGEKVKRNLNCKLVYDAHEYEVHRNPPLSYKNKAFVYALERQGIKNCDHVITCGSMIANDLQRIYKISEEKISVIYNSPSVSKQKIKSNIRSDLGVGNDEILLVSVGKLTINRGIEFTIEHLKKMKNVHFVSIGPYNSAFKKHIESEVIKHKIQNRFHILPPVPSDQVVNYIRTADVGIVAIQPVTKSYLYSMPNKLFELAFAKVPILIGPLPEASKIVTQYNLGEVFDSKSFSNFAFKVNSLNQKRTYYDTDKFKEFSEVYSWDTQEKKIAEIFKNLF